MNNEEKKKKKKHHTYGQNLKSNIEFWSNKIKHNQIKPKTPKKIFKDIPTANVNQTPHNINTTSITGFTT